MTSPSATTSSPRDLVASLTPFHRTKLIFIGAAFASFVLSVTLWFFVDRDFGLFVGLWVPAIHSLGTLVLTGERS
jgi:hypothetical protein